MFTDNSIHTVWIGKKLSLLEQLTLKLYQRRQMAPILWCYNEIENVPDGTAIRDANEILPEDSLFSFANDTGNGSCIAQWTDQFQLTLLQKYGGWYSQLDVACLKMPTTTGYFFAPHGACTVDVCVMQTPKDAPFIEPCLKELREKINKDTMTNIAWEDSMSIIGAHVKQAELSSHISHVVDGMGFGKYMQSVQRPEERVHFIHWWNKMGGDLKNHPKIGTFYHDLLLQEGLI